METPICDFVRKYSEEKKLRLHMPGHKGKSFLGMEELDITEIDGADVLYKADGIIKQSEENASSLFGSAKTIYSTEGSSLSIRAMLYLVKLYGNSIGKRPLIAAGRTAHKTFMTAAAVLDLDVVWLYPEKKESIISCEITAETLDAALTDMVEKPLAVYITSPDYLGNIADIGKISLICRKYNIILLVDNAHGAYLKFLEENCHPISLGADICCDSAHKTLPVLTGGAYLHISRTAPKLFAEQAENAMSVFASTSPSYLIMQSLDAANRYLSDGYTGRLKELCESVSALKKHLVHMGFSLVGKEPLKLTIAPKPYGYTGVQLAEKLSERGIVCEFSDPDFTVMMFTPEISRSDIEMLETVFSEIQRRNGINENPPIISDPERVLSLKEALFSPSEELNVHECCGRILASANISCPPAIPIVVCGERIDKSSIACFEYYGIETCRVVSES